MGFVTLYVREAHPGEHVDQPDDPETKLRHARAYQVRDRIPWPVAVDDLDGTLHRRLGPAATAYVMGTDGRVAGRTLWATDVDGIRRALQAAVAGEVGEERRPRVLPVVIGASEMHDVFARAGPRASRDMARVMPPVLLAGQIAKRLPRWSPLARSVVASVVTFGAVAGLLAGAFAIGRRGASTAGDRVRTAHR